MSVELNAKTLGFMKYNHTEITEDFFYIILEIIISYNKQNDDLFTLAQYLQNWI